jgi:hypothetical protein
LAANAGDGSVRVLRGEDLTLIGRIELGDDADNVRVDAAHRRVLVGYGKGALAVIDPVGLSKTADLRLKAHPEGFQIDDTGTEVFVNVPGAHEIAVADLATGSTQSLPTQGAGSNFPMAIDGEGHRVVVVFRSPPTLMTLSSQDRHVAAKIETCGDADDVFVDRKRPAPRDLRFTSRRTSSTQSAHPRHSTGREEGLLSTRYLTLAWWAMLLNANARA